MNDGVELNGFVWDVAIVDADGRPTDRSRTKNRIPNSALQHLIGAPFGLSSPVTEFYIGLFRGDFLPNAGTGASDIPSMQEMIDYQSLTRPEWNYTLVPPSTLDNSASVAEITFTQDRTIRGGFIVSSNVKGDGTGMMLSVVRFTTPHEVKAGQTARIATGLTYVSTSLI